MRSHLSFSALLFIALGAIAHAADAPKSAAATPTHVVKLITTLAENGAQYIIVSPPEGGQTVRLFCVGDAKTRAASLYADRGQLITVTVKPAAGPGSETCTAVAPFDGPKQLKSPRAYVFSGMGEIKQGTQTLTTVKLTRFDQTREAIIPNRPVPRGKHAPDPILLERAKALNNGDVVEADLAPGNPRTTFTLLDLDTYREPQVGEFVKLDTIKEGTRSTPAIVLNVDDTPQTVALPVAMPGSPLKPRESAAIAMARRLKSGNYVRFTARDDAGHQVLRDLEIDGSMEPINDRNYEFLSTFVRIHFYPYGADIDVYFYPRSGRPDDQLIEKGLRRVISSTSDARRIGIATDQVAKIRALLNDRLDSTSSDDLLAKQKMPWVKAYKAWTSARSDSDRARIEEQMAFAAQDFAAPWKKDIQAKYTIMKSFLDANQLEEVRKLGKKSFGATND